MNDTRPERNRGRMDKMRAAAAGGASPADTLEDLGKAFDSVGKVAAGIAALGGVAYLVALLVTALRLNDAGLPSHEVLSTLPRDQLIVGGTIELLATLAVAAVLVLLAGISRRSLVLQAVLIVALLLILPVSWLGGTWLVVTGGLVALLRFWRRPPALVVIGAFAVAAVLLTVVRQAEFPSSFAGATIALKAEAGSDGKPAIRVPPISGRYIGATSSDVLVGVKGKQREAVEELLKGARVRDSLVIVPRARVDQLVLTSSRRPVEPPDSLLASVAGIEMTCLVPTCRVGGRELLTPQ